jgi:CubicO group peptidase (beta-lactamase class C family)
MQHKYQLPILGAAALWLMTGCAAEQDSGLEQRSQAVVASNAAALAYPEYDLNVPAGYWWMHDATPAIIDAKIAEGFRLHDIDYLPSGNLTATFVANTGVYARTGSGWDHDLTDTELDTLVANSALRIVDIARRGVGTATRWAVAWVDNTGSQARTYKVVTNRTQANFEAEAVGFRVMSVAIGGDGSFNGVMIANTGADARNQYFGFGASDDMRAAMAANMQQCSQNAEPCKRAVDIASTGNDQFYVVYEDVITTAGPYTGGRVYGEGEQTWLVGALDYIPGALDRPDSIEHALARLVGRPTKLKPYLDADGNQHYMAIVASNGDLPRSGDMPSDNAAIAKLDALVMQQVRQAGLPGLTFGLMKNGKLVHTKGYGYRDLQSNQVLQPRDSVRIASVSKRIGKAAMLRLIEDGAIVPKTGTAVTLTTRPFGDIFDYTPPAGASPNLGDITIQHILDHTTGLRFDNQGNCGNATEEPEDKWCNPFQWSEGIQDWINTETALQTAAGITGGAFYDNQGVAINPTTPGVTSAYKNAGYHMIGHIIEEISDMEFEDYVKLDFTGPLNLDGLRIGRAYADAEFPDAIQAANYARPEFSSTEAWWERGDWVLTPEARYPASSFVSSPVDILRWQASLEGTAPGYRGLTNYAVMGNVGHGGYLPDVTVSGLTELTSGGAEYTYFWASTSDFMNGAMFRLDAEVQGFIAAEGANLPVRDLFPTYLTAPCLPAFHNLPVAEYQACWDYHNALGLTPKTLSVSWDGARISGAFEPGGRRTHHLLDGPTYNSVNLEELAIGSVPVFTNVVNVGYGPLFTAAWESSPGPSGTWWNLTPSAYVTMWNENYAAGLLQTDFFPYQDNGLKLASTWRKLPSDGYASYFDIAPADFPAFHAARQAEGLKITHFVAYLSDGGQTRYGAIWERVPGTYELEFDTTGAEYQATFDARAAAGWSIHRLHSYDADSFASIWHKPASGSGTLSFDTPGSWTKVQGPGTIGSSGWGTAGNSLTLSAGGFSELVSSFVTTADVRAHSASGAPTHAAVDILIPTQQPNPHWVGGVQLLVDIPSLSINHAFQAQVELTPLVRGEFVTIQFPLSTEVRNAIAANHNIRLYLALNSNTGAGTYFFDNLRFKP